MGKLLAFESARLNEIIKAAGRKTTSLLAGRPRPPLSFATYDTIDGERASPKFGFLLNQNSLIGDVIGRPNFSSFVGIAFF